MGAYSYELFNSDTKLFHNAGLGGVLHGHFAFGCDSSDAFWLRTFECERFENLVIESWAGAGGRGGEGSGEEEKGDNSGGRRVEENEKADRRVEGQRCSLVRGRGLNNVRFLN